MNRQPKLKFLLVTITLVAVITIYSVICGNPLSEYFAGNTANRYIAHNYPDCYVAEITYDIVGVFGGYRAVIKSENDLSFEKTVYIDLTGIAINQKAMDFFYEE